jgi:integrase
VQQAKQAVGNRGQYEHFLTWHAEKAHRKRGTALSAATLVAKRYRLQAVATELRCETPMQLAAVVGDRDEVESLFDKLYLRMAPATVVSTAVALRHFGEYAVAQGWKPKCYVRPEDSPSKVGRLKPVQVYRRDEVTRILLYARARSGLRFWALLATLEQTGMRISEALGLRWDDVALDAEQPHIALRKTKGGKQAYVPRTSKLRADVFTREHVDVLQSKGHPLWAKDIRESVFPYDYASAAALFRRTCEAAEVPWRDGFHVWRHTFAVRKLTDGVPIHIVSRWLNHSNISITDRYYSHTNALSFGDWVD